MIEEVFFSKRPSPPCATPAGLFSFHNNFLTRGPLSYLVLFVFLSCDSCLYLAKLYIAYEVTRESPTGAPKKRKDESEIEHGNRLVRETEDNGARQGRQSPECCGGEWHDSGQLGWEWEWEYGKRSHWCQIKKGSTTRSSSVIARGWGRPSLTSRYHPFSSGISSI